MHDNLNALVCFYRDCSCVQGGCIGNATETEKCVKPCVCNITMETLRDHLSELPTGNVTNVVGYIRESGNYPLHMTDVLG